MKKLVLKSVGMMAGMTLIGFVMSLVIAMVFNHLYWNVPSSFIYWLNPVRYKTYLGFLVIGDYLAFYTLGVMRILEWVRLYKDVKEV